MPVSQPEPSVEVIEKAQAASRGGLWGRLRRHTEQLLPAHAVFAVSLESLADSSTIAEVAEPVGWQFLAQRRSEPIAIEVTSRGLDVQIEQGPQITGASRYFESEAEGTEPERQARILRMPELGLMAVWLQTPGEEAEFVPLDPAPRDLQPLVRYKAREFGQLAAIAARELLEVSSTRGPDPEEEGGG